MAVWQRGLSISARAMTTFQLHGGALFKGDFYVMNATAVHRPLTPVALWRLFAFAFAIAITIVIAIAIAYS